MESLKINIPKGFKIGAFNQQTGEVSFEPLPKDIKEHIKTFSDVLQHLDIDLDDFEDRIEDMQADEAAYVKLKYIVQVLNEGWTPNWNNSSEYKYYPWFKMGSSSGGFSYYDYGNWYSGSCVGSRLCFKSSDLAKYAGNQFADIYKEFLTTNK